MWEGWMKIATVFLAVYFFTPFAKYTIHFFKGIPNFSPFLSVSNTTAFHVFSKCFISFDFEIPLPGGGVA